MALPQLFLVAPDVGDPLPCADAAVAAYDCASILVSESVTAQTVAALQAMGLAVIIKDCEPRLVHRLKADGLQLSRSEPVKALRENFKNESLGMFAATSRHLAMEGAEAGADYVAFAQNSQTAGEPLIAWWQAIMEVPVVAYDPVTPEALPQLLAQMPDFIRPDDAMWQSPDAARRVVSDLANLMRG
jgi:thiamine-phosphate pyrophosphorylase